MRGDINAVELYEPENRDFLVRIGYGIYDVAVGSTDGVGFEDVHRFSYLEAEGEDPKLYRRKVFNLVGRYYQNDLARVLWFNFLDYQMELTNQHGYEITLEEAALKWLDQYGHDFLKTWTLDQPTVPFRMRNQAELSRSYADVAIAYLNPRWRELLEAGFSLAAISFFSLVELTGRNRAKGDHYTRLVARLSGHPIRSAEETTRRQAEIEGLRHRLSQDGSPLISKQEATIEYYRRLNLVAELESQPVNLNGVDALGATA